MWKLLAPIAAGLALFGPPSAALAQAVLDGAALVDHGFEIASYVPSDSFAGPLSEAAFANQAFRFTAPFREKGSEHITYLVGGWTYDLQNETLRLALSPAGWGQAEFPQAEADAFMHYGLRIGTRNTSDRVEQAQNAYGAQFEVRSIEAQSIQIASLTRSERAASVDMRSEMLTELKMAPAEARQTVTDAQLVVEGVLVPYSGALVTQCRSSATDATIDVPLSTVIRTCVMNARITRVAIISGGGSTLAEWLP